MKIITFLLLDKYVLPLWYYTLEHTTSLRVAKLSAEERYYFIYVERGST